MYKTILLFWGMLLSVPSSIVGLQKNKVPYEKQLEKLKKNHATTYAYLLFHCMRFQDKDWPIPAQWYNNHLKILRQYGLLEKPYFNVTNAKKKLSIALVEPVVDDVALFFKSWKLTAAEYAILEKVSKLLPSFCHWLIFDILPFDSALHEPGEMVRSTVRS